MNTDWQHSLRRLRYTTPLVMLTLCAMNWLARPLLAQPPRTLGQIERLDPAFDALVPADAKLEIIVDGLDWCEGPLWIPRPAAAGARGGFLIFSDIPPNVIYRWDAKTGRSQYLHPSGYTGTVPRGGEVGTNGSTLDREGRLILCQHGDRRVA